MLGKKKRKYTHKKICGFPLLARRTPVWRCNETTGSDSLKRRTPSPILAQTSATICRATVAESADWSSPPPPPRTPRPPPSRLLGNSRWRHGIHSLSVVPMCVCLHVSGVPCHSGMSPALIAAWFSPGVEGIKMQARLRLRDKNATVVLFQRWWMCITKLWKPRAFWRRAGKKQKNPMCFSGKTFTLRSPFCFLENHYKRNVG